MYIYIYKVQTDIICVCLFAEEVVRMDGDSVKASLLKLKSRGLSPSVNGSMSRLNENPSDFLICGNVRERGGIVLWLFEAYNILTYIIRKRANYLSSVYHLLIISVCPF